MKTACIGEIIYDCFPGYRRLGGAPCNGAVMLSQLGCQSAVISAVGRDSPGADALQQLAGFGLELDLIQQTAAATGQVTIHLNADGVPDYDFPCDSAYDHLEWNQRLAAAAPSFDAVCFGTLAQRGPSARTIRTFLRHTRPDALRVLDLNLRAPFYDDEVIRESLKLAGILKLNDEELPILARVLNLPEADAVPALLESGIDLIALSRGDRGAELHARGQVSICPAAPVKQIQDTVGAGDSYTAVLIAGLLQNLSLDEINRRANRVAAFVCASPGATPELPPDLKCLRNQPA